MSDKNSLLLMDAANNCDSLRVPLSAAERKLLKSKYPYYGAQGIIDYVDNYLFDGEYLLVAEDGENLKSRKENLCTLVNGKFWVNNHAHILKAQPNFNIKYLYYYLNAIDFSGLVTGSGQPKLTKESLNSIPLVIPNKPTQNRVADFLWSLDKKIKLNNQISSELEAMTKLIYDYWFVQFDFPDENGRPYKSSGGKMVFNEDLKRMIPYGWKVQDFEIDNEICRGDLITSKTIKNGNVKLVSAGVKSSHFHDQANRSANVITVSSSGANAGFINFWREPIFASDCITIQASSIVETILAFQFLKMIQNHIYRKASGSAQPHVYPSDLSNLKYLLPPKNVIDLFETKVIVANDLIGFQNQEKDKLEELRDFLHPMLMNGQVTVSEAS